MMIKNYLIVAWRNLVKNKVYSFINITGLAIGLASFLLIALYMMDELSYDRYNDKADRIYRINSDIRFGGGDLHLPVTSDMMGQILKKDYPVIEQYTRIYASSGSKLIKKNKDFITEDYVAHVDSSFFDVFSMAAIAGNTHTALIEPNTVVITESAAKKYFGTTDVIGKILETKDDKPNYKITAVIKDIPTNSHFHFDFLFSMKNVDYHWGDLTSHNFHTYLLLKKGADYKQLEKGFDQYIEKYVLPSVQAIMKIKDMDEFRKSGNRLEYSLIPLTKIHLYSNRSFELGAGGNIQYIYIFSAVALFILLVACINFMNLTTARSASRAKEVGIRKVLGTEKRFLVFQFLTESILMALLSFVLAVIVASLVLPLFNNIADKSMSLKTLLSPVILPLLILLPFAVGLLAGSYPAFFLSAFRPIQVLKGKLKLGSNSGGLRSVLVVFQFSTSIILIVGTLVIYRQLNYIQQKDLGYNKNHVLSIYSVYTMGDKVSAFKNSVLQMTGVQSGTLSSYLPVSNSSRSDNTYFKNQLLDQKDGIDMQNWRVDYDYFKTMGMHVIKGREFSYQFGGDSTAVVINETAAQLLGYPDPVGQKIYKIMDSNKTKAYTVIGVVKNFNYESLKQSIGPLGFFIGDWASLASFKVNTTDLNGLISKIGSLWKEMNPGMPFNYEFLDDSFNKMYKSEQRVGKIALIFSTLAIFIACLGLFGLATFISEQRTKEIGIRKVLGASVQGIVQLLSKDFMKLVGISFVIASPLSWWIMNNWLKDFAYRIPMEWWIIGTAGFIALLIALTTVSFQAIKAAIANPVQSLRSE
jgi:putative ABC transport system permease protein